MLLLAALNLRAHSSSSFTCTFTTTRSHRTEQEASSALLEVQCAGVPPWRRQDLGVPRPRLAGSERDGPTAPVEPSTSRLGFSSEASNESKKWYVLKN